MAPDHRSALEGSKITGPYLEEPAVRIEVGNFIDGTCLVKARQSLVSVAYANNQGWDYARAFWKMVYVLGRYGTGNPAIPIERLGLVREEDDLLCSYRAYVRRSAKSLFLGADSVPIFRTAELRHEEIYICLNVGNRVPYVLKRYFEVEGGIDWPISYFVETQTTNDWEVAHWFNINDLYPGALRLFKLLLCRVGLYVHFLPHSVCVARIYAEGDKGQDAEQQSSTVKQYFPPWHFVAAALAGIFAVLWGLWMLCRERKMIVGTIAFLGELAIWAYAGVELFMWGFNR